MYIYGCFYFVSVVRNLGSEDLLKFVDTLPDIMVKYMEIDP